MRQSLEPQNLSNPLIFCTFANIMAFPFQLDILNLIIKGMLIGGIASAPMGPIGILCIQRTLNKGRWYGFVTGVGAAVSDFIYAAITAFGMSFVMDFVNEPRTLFFLKIFGSVLLLAFGIYCFRSNPTKNMRKSGLEKGSYWYNGITAFWVTLLNPTIIFLFSAAYLQLSFVVPDHPLLMCVGMLSVPVGALIWWFGLTWLVDKVRGQFNTNGIIIINRIIGSVVIIFSLVILVGTVFNLYSLSVY